ncbi:DNA primase large subunit [Heliocybe sulcata]|uniref:DNA primase large subunit n=1 Tax=Heliocybe sulcata TaxID=5364 RepID=A0A5C3NBH0_9AGAM|nr:DNA primase large subunit [Heliocybe sulcata]
MFKKGERKHSTTSSLKQEHPEVQLHSTTPYPHRLNFYDVPPVFDVTLEEFESAALARLRILAEIESSFVRNRPHDELKTVTDGQCKKYLPLNANTASLADLQSERRTDHVGHFVLRLAFCRSEELRRRFVKAEMTLFRVRWDTDDTGERNAFLKSRSFGWEEVGAKEKEMYKEELMAVPSSIKQSELRSQSDSGQYYKVRWTRVPDLVEKRRVFLKGGWAYVPEREQSSIVFQEFQTNLEKALDMTAKALPRLDEDSRLIPILNNLSQGFLAGVPSEWLSSSSSSAEGSGVKAEEIDDLAKKHFPMCMRNLHESLTRDRHLKHMGRLQYGLFLKVLGVSIDEAITFWRRSFNKITDDKFNKEYRYNIRHSYGLEGRRANYPAKSCQQILTQEQPGPNESHGCPYRHFSEDNLQSALLASYSAQGLKTTDLPEIMHTVRAGHYHVACTRVFEITHSRGGVKKGEGVGGGESVTHPNQYAARSRELEKAKQEKAENDRDAMLVDG